MKNGIVSLLLLASTLSVADNNTDEIKYKSVDERVGERVGEKTDEKTSDSNESEPFKGSHKFPRQDAMFGIGFNYFDAFGFQARSGYRLLDNRQFIAEFNNALYLEGGLGMTFYGEYKGLGNISGFHLITNVRWDAQHSEKWTLFATAGFGVNFITTSGVRGRDVKGGGLFPAFGLGSMVTLDPQWAARFDLSWQFLGMSVCYRF